MESFSLIPYKVSCWMGNLLVGECLKAVVIERCDYITFLVQCYLTVHRKWKEMGMWVTITLVLLPQCYCWFHYLECLHSKSLWRSTFRYLCCQSSNILTKSNLSHCLSFLLMSLLQRKGGKVRILHVTIWNVKCTE